MESLKIPSNNQLEELAPLVAKQPTKIGNRWIMKEPALKHHFEWLEKIREEQVKIMNSHRPQKIEIL